MAGLSIPYCADCGAPLDPRPPGRPGPPASYCSPRCRQAAHRDRRRRLDYVVPLDLAGPPPDAAELLADAYGIELPPTSDAADTPPSPLAVDQQIAEALLDSKALAATFLRLSLIARRTLAPRLEKTAQAIAQALADHWPQI